MDITMLNYILGRGGASPQTPPRQVAAKLVLKLTV